MVDATTHLFSNSHNTFKTSEFNRYQSITSINLSQFFPFLVFFPGQGITLEMPSTSCEMPGFAIQM